MAKNKNQCMLVPDVNDKPSKLYIELSKKINNKPLTNLIYAHYLQSGVGAQMDAQGYARNDQGQHSANDVYNFFRVSTMINEGTGLYRARQEAHSTDSTGNTIRYSDAMQALQLADDFNQTHSGTVASVTQHGNYFEILVDRRDARTSVRSSQVQEAMKMWEFIDSAFRANGLDLGALDFARELVNPTQGPVFVQYLHNLQRSSSNLMTKRDLEIVLTLGNNTSQVQRLITKYGSISDAAQAIWDANHRRATFTAGERTLVDAAIRESLKFNGLDLTQLENDLQTESLDFKANSEEEAIADTLKTLDRKYGINAQEIHLIGDEIDNLSSAAATAALIIQRQIRRLEKLRGTTQEGKQLEATLKQLLGELKNNHFYTGTLGFLREAATQVQNIDTILANINTTGTNMENCISASRAIMEVKDIIDGYSAVINSLTNMDALIVDESISDTDKQTLEDTAKKLRDYIQNKKKTIADLRESTMLNIATEVLGDSLPNGVAIASIVRIQETDLSAFDSLYSVGRISDPMIGAMGKVIRDAQDTRNKQLGDIALRIRRATHALYKSGSNSEFMYDEDNRIISDIDWNAYYQDRATAIKSFKKQGLRGFDLKDAIEQWEDQNTEDRVVDMVSGRSEKVPSSYYRKAFPALTRAQQEYYDTMMQLKGEIGTLLPQFAQQQYRPPQLRRSFIDAIKHAKNAKDVAKAIWNKMSDIWTVREDDTDFRSNGAVIEGKDYNISEGDFNNNPLRDIPVFYVNRLEDQGELMKDFSGALQALAGTAINYDAMNKVKDLVEFMGDYLKNDRKLRATKNDVSQADGIVSWGIHVFKDLTKKASNSNTSAIIDGFLDQHLYGIKFKNEQYGRWVKLAKSLIAYNSIKGLAMNVKGAIANYTVGELQMIVEAAGHEFYGFRDYAWAHKMLFGGPKEAGRIMGMMLNDRNSKEYLLSELFDPTNDNFGEQSHARYHKSVFRQLLGGDFTFLGYSAGEYLIHYVNMYAMLHHEKVTVDGKQMNLYDAFKVGNKVNGNSELMFKGTDVRDKDGNVIDQAWLENFRRRVRFVNQNTHGSMNEEDKGIFHQNLLGRFVMNFRQWMVEHYSRRFRGEHYDASSNDFREGFWRTYMRFMGSWAKGLVTFNTRAAIRWNTLTDKQKANVRRCLAEHALLLSLTLLSNALGEPKDHKKEFWYRMWIYQTKRMLLDVHASTPTGALLEAKTMLNSPISSVNTFNGFLYPILGWRDLDRTLKSGPHRGENTYWRNIKKYSLPFWEDIDQLKNMDEDESIFSVFNPEKKYH